MTREILLTQGYVAIVDDEDYELAMRYRWQAKKAKRTVYAMHRLPLRAGKRPALYLHRLIMQAPDDREVDHRDWDGLNCTRSNLRLATRAQNLGHTGISPRNTSGFLGVTWSKKAKRWQAGYKLAGRTITIGYFDDPREAARARDRAVLASRGEFAVVNVGVS